MARQLSENAPAQIYATRHVEFAQAVYKELLDKCLEQGLDLGLVFSIMFSIDSELVKEDAPLEDKGVLYESKDK